MPPRIEECSGDWLPEDLGLDDDVVSELGGSYSDDYDYGYHGDDDFGDFGSF